MAARLLHSANSGEPVYRYVTSWAQKDARIMKGDVGSQYGTTTGLILVVIQCINFSCFFRAVLFLLFH